METLLFQLVADDYHLKIRSERPAHYPERFRIQIDLANWKVPCPDYDPPYFVDPRILAQAKEAYKSGFVDPEDKWEFEDFIGWGREYSRADDGKPLNPSGRTGIEGRGSLWLWGSNPMIFFVPIRFIPEDDEIEVLMEVGEDDSRIINLHYRRGETFEEAIERVNAKVGFSLDEVFSAEVHEGYLYDPRQTDNAWVDVKAWLSFLDNKSTVRLTGEENLVWRTINPELINGLYSSYGFVLRQAIKHLYDNGIVREDFVSRIIEKTG